MSRWDEDWNYLMNAIAKHHVISWADIRDVLLDIIFWFFR